MEIFATAVSHVDNFVNGQGIRTLSAIKSEVPTFAAVTVAVNSQCTSPVNMKSSIRKVKTQSCRKWKLKRYKDSIRSILLGNNS